jgi:hypothetical protein
MSNPGENPPTDSESIPVHGVMSSEETERLLAGSLDVLRDLWNDSELGPVIREINPDGIHGPTLKKPNA